MTSLHPKTANRWQTGSKSATSTIMTNSASISTICPCGSPVMKPLPVCSMCWTIADHNLRHEYGFAKGKRRQELLDYLLGIAKSRRKTQ